MKKIIVQMSMIIAMFLLSLMLTISLSSFFRLGAFGTSFHLSHFLIMGVLAFVAAVAIHEFGHATSFVFQGVQVKAIFVLFLGMIFKKKLKIVFDWTMLMLLGGIVIPKAFEIHNQQDLEIASKKLRHSLLAGPIVSFGWVLSVCIVIFIFPTPMMMYLFYWTLSYTLMFSRSFFVRQGLMIGDIRAYQYIKHHEDYLVIILLQLSKQQGYDHQTGVFLYEKALQHLNGLSRVQTRKDYLLLQYVCDGYRLGYLKKTIEVPAFIHHVYIKRKIPKQYMSILPTFIYVLIMYEKMDTATHLYQFMLHYDDEPINESLLNTYVFNDQINASDFDAYMKMHAMYRHTMDTSFVYAELTKKANDVSFACTL